MALRDKWRDEAFFEALLKKKEEVLESELAGFAAGGSCLYLGRACQLAMEAGRVAYALGWPAERIEPWYRRYLTLLFDAADCFQTCGQDWGDTADRSNIANIRFVCSAIVYGECLGFGRAELRRMAESIPADIEQLTDRLLSAYQPGRRISEVAKETGKYKPLHTILGMQDKGQQAKKIRAYLDSWPKRLGVYGPDGGRARHKLPTYDGYWCYEAAAVVIVCGIDDESFREHEFYPGELMSWRQGGWAAGEASGTAAVTAAAQARHERNLSALAAPGFKRGPDELERYKAFFEALCPHLPEALRQHLWNTLVDSVWEEYGEYGFLDALSEAVNIARLPSDYGYRCLLHVDWSDLESAQFFAEELLREHGLADGFEYDPATSPGGDSEDPPVIAFFKALNDYLRPKGYCFVEIDTGGDCHLGVIAREEDKARIAMRAQGLDDPGIIIR